MDQDDATPGATESGAARLSAVRAGVVLVIFVVAVAVLVAVGTRPSVNGTPSSAEGTSTTTTVAAAGGGSTTTTTAHHHGATTTTTTQPHSSVSVVVANATNTSGLAAHYSTIIGAAGYTMKTPTNASTTVPNSVVYYAAGQQAAALSIASTIGVKPAQVQPLTTAVPVPGVTGTDVVVVVGQDLATPGS
jgi:LytR cell envelope-related transcriptional attenuator